MRERVVPISKGGDIRLNLRVNPQRRSLKGILLLFINPYVAGARDTEHFFNPDITKVKVTVNGVPNRVYNEGISGTDMWNELTRYFNPHTPKTKPATEKNPGRVAAGKRLAAHNRLVREAKKKAEAEAAKPASTSTTQASAATSTQSGDNNTEASCNSLMTILGIGGLVVSALGVYYQREAIMKRRKPTAQPTPPAPAQPEPEPTPSMSLIPVKRGVRKME